MKKRSAVPLRRVTFLEYRKATVGFVVRPAAKHPASSMKSGLLRFTVNGDDAAGGQARWR
jgi:hypothetical protein